MRSRAEIQAEYRKRHNEKFKRGINLLNNIQQMQDHVDQLFFEFSAFRDKIKEEILTLKDNS